KSGTDDASARHDDTAFDPSTTDPHSQKEKVGEKTGVSAVPPFARTAQSSGVRTISCAST
ncbi:MAG: hypothetical protein Q9228_007990, partial [Teloschistes exilis]